MGGKEPILPSREDVIYSVVVDSEAIDYASYEDWAESFGYDQDSRKAERIYHECLTIALKLRSAIGDDGLARLRVAFQDY